MIKEKKHAQASRLEQALHAAAAAPQQQTFVEHPSDFQDGVPASELFGGKQGYTSVRARHERTPSEARMGVWVGHGQRSARRTLPAR